MRFIVGLVILFVGAAIAADVLFAVSLPVFRIAIAVLLLGLGARMLMTGWGRDRRAPASGEAWLAERHFAPEGTLTRDARFDVAFGRGLVDLTHLDEPPTDVTVTVDALFGTAVVRVDPSIPYDVVGSSAFGDVRMPDHSAAAMGGVHYRSPADRPPHLHLKLNAVFGACHVIENPPAAPVA